MSLTSHLGDTSSPIGQYLRNRFPQTTAITRVTNSQLRAATTLCPQPLSGESYPYGGIGRAIDYRIRYSFADTPWKQFVAAKGAYLLLSSADNARHAAGLILGFFTSLAAAVADIRPVGRILTKDEETELARYCYVLGLFESVFRTRDVPDVLREAVCSYPDKATIGHTGKQPAPAASEAEVNAGITQLLTSVADHWADDLASLGMLATDRLGRLLSQPVNLNPTFAGSRDVGGADADLIVDGCLIDLKASVKPVVEAVWLRQLAGYVLLDYDNEHGINAVGIYMVRQGKLLRWPLDEFIRVLTGDPAVALPDLRREFHALCTTPRSHVDSSAMSSDEDERIQQASRDEVCVRCGTALVCTYEENVERMRPRGHERSVVCLTVCCHTCGEQVSSEYVASHQMPTARLVQKYRANLIADFNRSMAFNT